MLFEDQKSLGLNELEDRKLQPQEFDIGLLIVARSLEQSAENSKALLENGFWIADDEGADGSARMMTASKGCQRTSRWPPMAA